MQRPPSCGEDAQKRRGATPTPPGGGHLSELELSGPGYAHFSLDVSGSGFYRSDTNLELPFPL